MTRTCWTAPGEGVTVEALITAAPSLAAAALVAKRAIDSRPGTRWAELLRCRTNVVLLGSPWGPEDAERLDKMEVKQ